jgi:glyoxylase-like metal-dependent hydrolase (beta-lactamase superfamily II)
MRNISQRQRATNAVTRAAKTRNAFGLAAAATVLCALPQLGLAQAGHEPPAWVPLPPGPARGEVEVLHVKGNVYMIAGAGANITVQAGDDGMLLVDTGTAAMSSAVLDALATIPKGGPLRYIINTIESLDHTGGNEAIVVTGETVPLRGENYGAGPQGGLDYKRASLISYLNVFTRMVLPTSGNPVRDEDAWPDNTYSTPFKRLYFNDEPIIITHMTANTDGNSVVLFRRSDVVSVGDILDMTRYPLIDIEAGGSIDDFIVTLNSVISLAVPLANSGGGTLVIPGHGHVADHAEVVAYRDMMVIVRDRIKDMIDRGMTLEQIQEAGPTRGYDAQFGAERGPWTTRMFVEAAYRSLTD